jgi:general secretion pathway protein H
VSLPPEKHLVRGEKGFTLLELILVVALIGISSGIVVARFYHGADQVGLKTSAKEVSASLRYSRNHAVYERRPYVVIMNRTGYSIYTTVPSAEGAAEVRRVVKRALASGISADTGEEGEIRIDFFPLGDSTGGQIKLINRDGSKIFIRVEQVTGRVRIIG